IRDNYDQTDGDGDADLIGLIRRPPAPVFQNVVQQMHSETPSLSAYQWADDTINYEVQHMGVILVRAALYERQNMRLDFDNDDNILFLRLSTMSTSTNLRSKIMLPSTGLSQIAPSLLYPLVTVLPFTLAEQSYKLTLIRQLQTPWSEQGIVKQALVSLFPSRSVPLPTSTSTSLFNWIHRCFFGNMKHRFQLQSFFINSTEHLYFFVKSEIDKRFEFNCGIFSACSKTIIITSSSQQPLGPDSRFSVSALTPLFIPSQIQMCRLELVNIVCSVI
ncbi:hypothetical protein ROZALSC1DRAFT_23363, partial [Rozella allomycis CSF55]